MSSVRIVHLTPELPAAAGWTGGATRQFHLLRRLAERGHDIVVVAPVQAAQERFVPDLEAVGVHVGAPRRSPRGPPQPLGGVARGARPRAGARRCSRDSAGARVAGGRLLGAATPA